MLQSRLPRRLYYRTVLKEWLEGEKTKL
jgi:hypothetical protein